MKTDPSHLTTQEAAEKLRASECQVRRWLAAGKLRGIRRAGGGRWLIEAQSVREFLGEPAKAGESRGGAGAATERLRKKGYAV